MSAEHYAPAIRVSARTVQPTAKRSSASDGKGHEELSSSRIILAVSFVILAAVVVVVLALARMNLLRLTLQIVLLRVKK